MANQLSEPETLYEFSARRIDGRDESLSVYEGEVLLIVNVASRCGFTPQYEGLESLQKRYRREGFNVLAFPCNQFGGQEPGTGEEIQAFCITNFGTSFPLFEKVDVNGNHAHRLYQWLKARAPGLLGSKAIKWNFTKFLVARDGRQVQRFAPQDSPAALAPHIESALGAKPIVEA